MECGDEPHRKTFGDASHLLLPSVPPAHQADDPLSDSPLFASESIVEESSYSSGHSPQPSFPDYPTCHENSTFVPHDVPLFPLCPIPPPFVNERGITVYPPPSSHPEKVKTVTCRHWKRGYCELEEMCNFKHDEVLPETIEPKKRRKKKNKKKKVLQKPSNDELFPLPRKSICEDATTLAGNPSTTLPVWNGDSHRWETTGEVSRASPPYLSGGQVEISPAERNPHSPSCHEPASHPPANNGYSPRLSERMVTAPIAASLLATPSPFLHESGDRVSVSSYYPSHDVLVDAAPMPCPRADYNLQSIGGSGSMMSTEHPTTPTTVSPESQPRYTHPASWPTRSVLFPIARNSMAIPRLTPEPIPSCSPLPPSPPFYPVLGMRSNAPTITEEPPYPNHIRYDAGEPGVPIPATNAPILRLMPGPRFSYNDVAYGDGFF